MEIRLFLGMTFSLLYWLYCLLQDLSNVLVLGREEKSCNSFQRSKAKAASFTDFFICFSFADG